MRSMIVFKSHSKAMQLKEVWELTIPRDAGDSVPYIIHDSGS